MTWTGIWETSFGLLDLQEKDDVVELKNSPKGRIE
jgi:hypothetical protein